jgi:Zn-dependent M28 family amino/carboxypeptidase
VSRRLAALLLIGVATAADAAPRFDGAAAWRHVQQLVAMGPRPSGSPALSRARRYVVDQLTRAGLRVRLQPFEAQTPDGPVTMANVVGVVAGRRPDVIVVGGHYDTKLFRDFVFVGANDGGSSTGWLLELARRLRRAGREFTYWVTFFDGEEARREWSETDSLYGSRHFVAELSRSGELGLVRAAIVVDMIGDRHLNILREETSTPWLTDLLWASAHRLGHADHFRPESLRIEDDHVPLLRAGIPTALVIDIDYPPWHTPRDTLAHVSPRSLQVVGEVVLEALPALEDALTRGPGGQPR